MREKLVLITFCVVLNFETNFVFSQDVASCYYGGYVSGADTILFHFYFKEDYYGKQFNEIEIQYFSFRKPELNRNQNLSCEISDSQLWILDDSAQGSVYSLEVFFVGDSSLALMRSDFLYYPANSFQISMTSCPIEEINVAPEILWGQGDQTYFEGEDPIYDLCEVEPTFPGGPEAMMTFVHNNLVMPSDYNQNEFTGTIYVQFVVEKDGSLTNLKIIKGGTTSLDKEALRVVASMPNWIPGMEAGKAVRVRYIIPFGIEIRE